MGKGGEEGGVTKGELQSSRQSFGGEERDDKVDKVRDKGLGRGRETLRGVEPSHRPKGRGYWGFCTFDPSRGTSLEIPEPSQR